MTIEWTRDAFERLGFVGWKRFGALVKADLPVDIGVYVVVREPGSRPEFLAESVGGPHKQVSLTVPVEMLETAWADGAEVVYVGKAGGRLGLQDRLWAFAQQGRGRSAGHAGGKFVWQLEGSDALRVGWRATPGEDVGDIEEALLALHIDAFHRRPFANRKGGTSMRPDTAQELLTRVLAGD